MYRYVTCPHCGQKLCKATLGCEIESSCSKCKTDFMAKIDADGCVHLATAKIISVIKEKTPKK